MAGKLLLTRRWKLLLFNGSLVTFQERKHGLGPLQRTDSTSSFCSTEQTQPFLWAGISQPDPIFQMHLQQLSCILLVLHSQNIRWMNDDEMHRWRWYTDHWAILFFSPNFLCKLSQRKSAIVSYEYYCHQNTIGSECKQVNKLIWNRFTVGIIMPFGRAHLTEVASLRADF